MFERFTAEARQIVVRAQDEARGLRHPWIGTEHLLLGMLTGPGDGGELLGSRAMTAEWVRQELRGPVGQNLLDAAALRMLGIDLDEVRRAAEEQFGPGALEVGAKPMPRGHIPFTKRAKKVLELAVRESQALHSERINSVHLLLGMLREHDGLGAQLIERACPDVAALDAEARERAGRQAA